MNTFYVSIASLMLLASSAAFATGNHPPKPDPSKPVTATADSSSASTSAAKANSDSSSTSSAAGGVGQGIGSVDYYSGGGRAYSIFSAGVATPLPATTCPKGDSQYFQLLFGVVTWATSTTRTEMECLDKVLAAMRTRPMPAPAVLPLDGALHPAALPSQSEQQKASPAAKPKNGKPVKSAAAAKTDGKCGGTTKAGYLLVNCI